MVPISAREASKSWTTTAEGTVTVVESTTPKFRTGVAVAKSSVRMPAALPSSWGGVV
jgi:hypothetical protein